jgi:hypothetical protein
VAVKRSSPAKNHYLAYHVIGEGRHEHAPIVFAVLKGRSLKDAKRKLADELAPEARDRWKGEVSRFYVRKGALKGPVNQQVMDVLFGEPRKTDAMVVRVDVGGTIAVTPPPAKQVPKSASSHVGFIAMRGQGERWFAIPVAGYMEARKWMLRKAATWHFKPQSQAAQFGTGRGTSPKVLSAAEVTHAPNLPVYVNVEFRQALIAPTKTDGRPWDGLGAVDPTVGGLVAQALGASVRAPRPAWLKQDRTSTAPEMTFNTTINNSLAGATQTQLAQQVGRAAAAGAAGAHRKAAAALGQLGAKAR